MCDCFALGAAAASQGRRPTRAPAASDDAAALALACAAPWIDVHAHPGRCFLRGLPPDDPYVRALGADAVSDALADQKAGHVTVACCATVADLRVLQVGPGGRVFAGRHFEPGEARADHLRQLGALRSLWEDAAVQAIRTPADVVTAHAAGRSGVMITCEGADFLEGELDGIQEAFDAGVRSVTLVHYRVNELGDIQTETPIHGGLSDFGREVIRAMNRLGIIVDLAHATHDATKDALDVAAAPMMISHSHLAAGKDSHPRLLSPEHARAVAEAGGLIGAWPSGVAIADFEGYVDEIVRLVDLVGVLHVAIGTDLDANYRPVVQRYAEFPALVAALLRRGLAASEVRRIAGENFLDLFRSVSEAATR
jgi:membrane dipeptidase